jgi:mannose-6-phosphate isomerase-like protein (cupin superfamily)
LATIDRLTGKANAQLIHDKGRREERRLARSLDRDLEHAGRRGNTAARHLHEDEVLYIRSGVAHVRVGSLQGKADAGTLVFIPRNTWVSVNNIGKTPVLLLFEFNAPGFDRYMRCESVPAGEPALPVGPSEDKRCAQLGDVEYR